jgi:hypothetical protein
MNQALYAHMNNKRKMKKKIKWPDHSKKNSINLNCARGVVGAFVSSHSEQIWMRQFSRINHLGGAEASLLLLLFSLSISSH